MGETVGDESIYYRLQGLKEGTIQFTDTSNAFRLVREHGKDIRYNAAWKKWIVWTGDRWQIDDGYLIHNKSIEVIHSIYDEMLKTTDYRDRMDIEKYALQSESLRRRKAFIESASLMPGMNITSNDVDKDPWLLNVENGTIDLKKGEFREHQREDMITKIAHVRYEEGADCPVWKQFIREIMDFKPDLIEFLQRAAGWALTGDTSEQTMFISFGSGANGKSTFLNVLMKLLGDYAVAASTETFMKKNGDQISNDIARLRGTRFVVTSEAEQGKRLSEPLIKLMTGTDAMTARFLYGEYFEFIPTFKIFMASNHKPVIRGTDLGIWRRITLIPFTTTIAPERQDKHLEEKLLAEKSGILNWLILGTQRWFEKGLAAPQIITSATEEYRSEMDVLGAFIKECCIQGPGISVRARELFKAYQEWCEENNERASCERVLAMRFKELGLEKWRTAEARYWKGIMLKTELL
ncbi:phage/plasmid primase, P4 family [Treponema primitia]|uniref:DNA primase family protein n=1 Tax=Treponema primitia TaxID=88058 RepID=UPI00398139AA